MKLERTRSILVALAEAIVPVTMNVPRAAERVADMLLAQTAVMDPMMRWSLLLGLWLLEWGFLLQTGSRLRRLPVWRRSKAFEGWLHSRSYYISQIGIAYNSIVFLAFYNLPESLEQLDFSIDATVQGCIRKRAELAKNEPPQTAAMIRV